MSDNELEGLPKDVQELFARELERVRAAAYEKGYYKGLNLGYVRGVHDQNEYDDEPKFTW